MMPTRLIQPYSRKVLNVGTGTDRPVLGPNTIGLFIGFQQCPRYLKQSLNQIPGNEDELGVFLSEAGDRFEDETLRQLKTDAAAFVDAGEWDIPDDIEEGKREIHSRLSEVIDSATPTRPALVYQPPVRGRIGVWDVKGRGDVLAVWKHPHGLSAHVLEVKASRDIQPYHQIQACIYSKLIQDHLAEVASSVIVDTGIVYRESDELDFSDRSSLPTIEDIEVVEEDVNRLCREGGVIDRIFKRDKVKYSLTGKCNQCLYNEACFGHAVRTRNLALLGLTEGEQRILEKHDITTVEQLASLKENIDKPRPHDFEELPDRDPEGVKRLLDEPGLGGRIDDLVQYAQSVLGGLNPDHEQARNAPLWGSPLQGAGEGALPATNPSPGQAAKMSYDADDLVRVYLYVREDFMRDTVVLLGGRVVRKSSPRSPREFSAVAEAFPDEREDILDVEGELLAEFFTKLFAAIHFVAEGDESAVMHLYFYSRNERDTLVETILRQMPRFDNESFNAIRDLMGYRRAIDQPMVSIVQDELIQRFALQYPGNGILPVLEQATSDYCDCGCDKFFGKEDWRVTREDGFEFNLRDVFKYNFFTFKLPVERGADGYWKPAKNIDDPEEFYPLRARFDNQIPLEYLWAAEGKLDLSWASNENHVREIEKYRWHDPGEQSTRLTTEDVGLLGEKLCHALQHIESSMGHHNPFLGKDQINIPDLPEFNLGQIDLARSLSDYLALEYYADRQEKYRHFARSPRERVRTGYAAIVRVTDVSKNDDGQLVSGSLLYHVNEFHDPDTIAYSCRIKGAGDTSYGSFRLANPVRWDEEQGAHKDVKGTPRKLEQGLPVEVKSIDVSERRITFQLSEFNTSENYIPNKNRDAYEYVPRHDVWTDNPDEEGSDYGVNRVFVRKGDRFILDRQTDSWTANHANKVLAEYQDNQEQTGLSQFQPTQSFTGRHHFYQVLNQLIGGDPK